jgi:hypothetical protein
MEIVLKLCLIDSNVFAGTASRLDNSPVMYTFYACKVQQLAPSFEYLH